MFEFDEFNGADTYTLTVISVDDNKQFSITKKSLACLVSDGLHFGKKYNWYYTAQKKGQRVFKSATFEFTIENSILIDTARYRYLIQQQTRGKFQHDLIVIDNIGVAINRKGEAMWYLPTDSAGQQKIPYRNMNFTKNGTVTFLKNASCCEKDIYGNILWQAPNDGIVSGDSNEYYHHDFAKLDDGTYLTSSYQFVKRPNYYDPQMTSRVRYNTLIQYDASGNVLWSWNEKDHVSDAEIFKQATAVDYEVAGTHLNGFDYDKKTNTIITSYRNNSTLLLIDKATGKVLNVYKGEGKHKGEEDQAGIVRFLKQHGPSFKPDGTILFYNNNVQKDDKAIAFPIIMNIRFLPDNSKPVVLWEYECKMKEHPEGWMSKEGYVSTLTNKNMLVCVGGSNKIFEVSPQKQVVWEMNCEEFITRENKWQPFSNYRCHSVSSLYPQYFTVQNLLAGNSFKPGASISFKINNDGTDTAEYLIEVTGNITYQDLTASVKIAPQSAVVKTIRLPKNIAGYGEQNNNFDIKISSVINPADSKKIVYTRSSNVH